MDSGPPPNNRYRPALRHIQHPRAVKVELGGGSAIDHPTLKIPRTIALRVRAVNRLAVRERRLVCEADAQAGRDPSRLGHDPVDGAGILPEPRGDRATRNAFAMSL